jgi:hypothetical protein
MRLKEASREEQFRIRFHCELSGEGAADGGCAALIHFH